MEQVIRLHGVRVEIVFVPDLLLRCGRLSAPLLQLSPASAQVINQRSDRTPSSGTGGHPLLHHRAQPGNLVHLSYEYAYNSLTSSATDLKPPQYQLSLFSEHEVELTVPSVKHHLQVWRCCFSPSHLYANHQRAPAPTYSPRHKAGLAAEDIPLRATSRKLLPHYIGHFEVDRIISPSAVKPVLLFFHRVGDSTSGWSPNHHTCHPHLFVIQLAVLRPAYTTILRQFVRYPTSVIL